MSQTLMEPTIAAPEPKPTHRVRRPISPEIASMVREADEAFAATKLTAEAIANATIASASGAVERANAIKVGTMRAVLRYVGLEDGTIVGTEGTGPESVLIIEVPLPALSTLRRESTNGTPPPAALEESNA